MIVASTDVGGHRAVTVDGRYATGESLQKYAGVTLHAASGSELVRVQREGPLQDDSFSFTEGPLYVGDSGRLVQTAPTGELKRVGWAVSSQLVNLDPQPTISLAA